MSDFKTFQNKVTSKCDEWEINKEDLYFSQTTNGYYADCKPTFPNRSIADFTIFQDNMGCIKIYNSALCVPIVNYMDENLNNTSAE